MVSKRAFILFLTIAVSSTLLANDVRLTPTDPQADRLVAEALAQAPEQGIAAANIEAAKRRIEPARTLPDPSANLTYQNDGRNLSLGDAEGSYLGLMLSQAFPWPGKLGLAAKVATSEAKEIEIATTTRTQRAIEARVRNAWYDLVLAHAVQRLIDDRRATASQIEATVRDRYAAGLAVQQDVLRAQIELARIDELDSTQRAAISAKLAELNRLLGRPQDQPIDAASELPSVGSVPPASAVIASVAERSPEAAAALQGVETERARVEVAKKNFLPDFVVSGGSMYRAGFEMGPMWQIGVGMSIPVWTDRRQKNQLAEAEARLEARGLESGLVPRDLEVRTRERLAQLQAANEVAALYKDKVIPLDELSLESALASYSAGKIPFITVLDAVNVLYSDRVSYNARLAESAKWRVAIDEASLDATSMSVSASMPSTSSIAAVSGATSGASPNSSGNSSMGSMR